LAETPGTVICITVSEWKKKNYTITQNKNTLGIRCKSLHPESGGVWQAGNSVMTLLALPKVCHWVSTFPNRDFRKVVWFQTVALG
jgi:hypothetical protein